MIAIVTRHCTSQVHPSTPSPAGIVVSPAVCPTDRVDNLWAVTAVAGALASTLHLDPGTVSSAAVAVGCPVAPADRV